MKTVIRTANSIIEGEEMDDRLIKMAISTLIRVSVVTSCFGLVSVMIGTGVYVLQHV